MTTEASDGLSCAVPAIEAAEDAVQRARVGLDQMDRLLRKATSLCQSTEQVLIRPAERLAKGEARCRAPVNCKRWCYIVITHEA